MTTLLERAVLQDGVRDEVDRYILLLCAKQVVREVAKNYALFWKSHEIAAKEIEDRLAAIEEVRSRIEEAGADGIASFLDWFEPRFLKRAQVQEHNG